MCSNSSYPQFLQPESTNRTIMHIIAVLGFPAHIFGAYCILVKTPKQMSDMKNAMFNLHFWSFAYEINMGVLTVPFLTLPAFCSATLGILTDLGAPMPEQVYFGMMMLGIVIISIVNLFETRFFHLYAQHSCWRYLRRPWLAINVLFALGFWLPVYLTTPDQQVAKRYFMDLIPCLPSFMFEDRFLVVGVESGIVVNSMTFFLNITSPQTLTFLCLIFWNMRQMSKSAKLSKKTLSLQRKFLLALILQVSLPNITLILPITSLIYSIKMFYYNQGLNNITTIVTSMHGTMSAVALIFIHTPYREAFLDHCMIRNMWKKKEASVAPTFSQVTLT